MTLLLKKARNLGKGCWRHGLVSVKIAMLKLHGLVCVAPLAAACSKSVSLCASESIPLHFTIPVALLKLGLD